MPKSDYAQQEFFRPIASSFPQEDELSEDDLLGNEELLSEPHLQGLTRELTSPLDANAADFDRLQSNLDQSSLDQSSLATILEMLTVITSAEELMLLETLSEAQKRQVWSATPEPIRTRLKQIREGNVSTGLAEAAVTETDFANQKGLNSRLSDSNQLDLPVGAQVVLIAKPKLTSAELTAIWDVIEVHEGYARIKAKNLGTRNYPTSWMRIYPKPLSGQA